MKRFLLYVILIPSLFSFSSNAEVALTRHYSLIEKEIKTTAKDTLVIFDVDDVLLVPIEEYSFAHPFRDNLAKLYNKNLSEDELHKLWSKILLTRKVKILDPVINNILLDVKQRKIPTIALTKCKTGRHGIIEKNEDWRINELKKADINFEVLSPFKGKVEFTDIIPINGRPSSTPMIKEGVIFSPRFDKGIILERVMNYYKWYPGKIIFIDDKLENLLSVEKICKKYNIEFSGYVITAVKYLPEVPLDIEKEKRRFKILEKEGKWMSDVELMPYGEGL